LKQTYGIVKPFRRPPTGSVAQRFATPTRNRVFNAVIATAHAPQPKTLASRLYGFLLAFLGIKPG